MNANTIGKAIKTRKGYTFIKEYDWQGEYYKYIGDLDLIDDDYPVYSAEYQGNDYETKTTLKKLCEGSKIKWQDLLSMLDWQHAESLFYELDDTDDLFNK